MAITMKSADFAATKRGYDYARQAMIIAKTLLEFKAEGDIEGAVYCKNALARHIDRVHDETGFWLKVEIGAHNVKTVYVE